MALKARHIAGTIAAAALIAAGISLATGGRTPADGWLLDSAIWLRAKLFPPSGEVRDGPVMVVTLDARSLSTPPLTQYPRALFAPVWSNLIEALVEAEARTIAFDLLLSYSGNAFQPRFDLPFQKALGRNRQRIVLGRSASTLPARDYLAPLRFEAAALGLLELEPDADGVYRRIPPGFAASNGDWLPSLSAAALARAGLKPPEDDILLTPTRHLERIAHLSAIDVLACRQAAPDALQALVAGRIVFIGTALAEEDRKLSPARFLPPAPAPEVPAGARGCDAAQFDASVPSAHSVPGVYLHAAGVQTWLSGNVTRDVATPARVLVAAVLAGAMGAAALALLPWLAVVAAVLAALAAWVSQTLLLQAGWHLPTSPIIAGFVAAVVMAYGVRYLVEERRRLRIQNAFGRYLAPSLVDTLLDSTEDLRLGGASRDVTIMFADLSGFTALSTKVTPEQLVELTNDYLAIIAEAVDASGGYVDKFIGDAVMAIWGAPADDSDHARHGVAAALSIAGEIEYLRAQADARGEHGFGIKIGLHSGPAVVGNVGSNRRYNYTAVGETVNIASRLEGLPGVYGCPIVIGETTARALGDDLLTRHLDFVVVKGRETPLSIYQAIAWRGDASPEQIERAARYEAALALYRERRFQEAADAWGALAEDDPPSALMRDRALDFVEMEPVEDWDGVFVMRTK